MIRIPVLFFLINMMTGLVSAQKIVVGTFNLRYANDKDTGNLWKDRAPVAAALIRFHEFDIIGTQEGLQNQLEDLQRDLPAYSHYGIGRDDGRSAGEHSAIFYKKNKFTVIDSGDFWLSEHPEKPGFGWDAKNNRICSWLKLKENKHAKTFYVFNAHYDHQGFKARKESSKLILEKIRQITAGGPVIFTGDFNGNNTSDWYKTIQDNDRLKDARGLANDPYINNGSFNAFKANNPSNDLIDHIFVSPEFTVHRYGILTDTYHGRFPSDHFPVLVELGWAK